ncbi:hypothetical protein [Pyxidicoccus sp. MSG2]|uniref:hypothetical protein n=1 Tax=Pyxidicoccus sp. MSG2 TaxID=2996790 RepID=UPI00226D46BE|nr:hypothetical protein [Pyxidicoccus sp. MSG2]MCY1019683.1 hypothetical protein [Pyxidicoccus sp. MSG2]
MQRHKRFASTWTVAGLGATAVGRGLESKDVALTAAPKQYTIGGSRVRYRREVGGFGWVSDDIQWR